MDKSIPSYCRYCGWRVSKDTCLNCGISTTSNELSENAVCLFCTNVLTAEDDGRKFCANCAGDRTPTFLFIGETGSGKTTLVNSLKDHFLGKSFDKRTSVIERSNRKPGEGDTEEFVKEIIQKGADDLQKIQLIDTPGLGEFKDTDFLKKIVDAINSVHHVSVICFVFPPALNRTTLNTQYIVMKLKQLLAKSAEHVIIPVITSTKYITKQVKETMEFLKFDPAKIITIENKAYCDLDSGDESLNTQYQNEQKNEFQENKKFLEKLLQCGIQNERNYLTSDSRQVFGRRAQLWEEVRHVRENQINLRMNIQRLDDFLLDVQKNGVKKYSFTKDSTTWVSEQLSIRCQMCNESCATLKDISREVYKNAVFENFCCTKCPYQCHFIYHSVVGWNIKTVQEEFPLLNPEVIKNLSPEKQLEELKNSVNRIKSDMNNEVNALKAGVLESYQKLCEFSLNSFSVEMIACLESKLREYKQLGSLASDRQDIEQKILEEEIQILQWLKNNSLPPEKQIVVEKQFVLKIKMFGGIVNTFPFPENTTVGDVISEIRENTADYKSVFQIFTVFPPEPAVVYHENVPLSSLPGFPKLLIHVRKLQ